jgi:hypothetical protein
MLAPSVLSGPPSTTPGMATSMRSSGLQRALIDEGSEVAGVFGLDEFCAGGDFYFFGSLADLDEGI